MRRNEFFASRERGLPARLEVWAVAFPGLRDYFRHGVLADADDTLALREASSAPDACELDGEDRGF